MALQVTRYSIPKEQEESVQQILLCLEVRSLSKLKDLLQHIRTVSINFQGLIKRIKIDLLLGLEHRGIHGEYISG